MTGLLHQNDFQSQERTCAPDFERARKRHAGHLVRINLPPLMGQRDAALDWAAKALEGNDGSSIVDAATANAIAVMYADAARDCSKIIGMFNSPDTIARESRLLNNVRILAELSSALADFYRLQSHMTAAVETDAAGDAGSNQLYVQTLDQRMMRIAAELSAQLGDARKRYRHRIYRYRDYAVKNFSPENAGRYRSAYDAVSGKYAEMCANICQQETSK